MTGVSGSGKSTLVEETLYPALRRRLGNEALPAAPHDELTGTDEADPATSLFYIADDYVRLRERVVRLTKKEAHSEFPRSQQRHMVSNVRITSLSDNVADVSCNFVTYRAKRGVVDTYYGKHLYRLDTRADPFRILSKRSILGMDMLYPGKLTIII